MRFSRIVLPSVLIFYVSLAARAETVPDDVISALAKASSDEVFVHGLVDTTAMTPLGNGLALVDARWQGHELVGLIENNGLLPGQLRIEGLFDDPFFFDVNAATVLETPLGPIGIASDARGIIAILIGL